MFYKTFIVILSSKSSCWLTFLSLQDEVNQIMETNLWLRHVSDVYALCEVFSDATLFVHRELF